MRRRILPITEYIYISAYTSDTKKLKEIIEKLEAIEEEVCQMKDLSKYNIQCTEDYYMILDELEREEDY